MNLHNEYAQAKALVTEEMRRKREEGWFLLDHSVQPRVPSPTGGVRESQDLLGVTTTAAGMRDKIVRRPPLLGKPHVWTSRPGSDLPKELLRGALAPVSGIEMFSILRDANVTVNVQGMYLELRRITCGFGKQRARFLPFDGSQEESS